MKENRLKEIRRIIADTGEIQLLQLKEQFPDVSTMTLRRDLILLEREGYIIRTYGGAVNVRRTVEGEEDNYSKRAVENLEAKKTIADKAALIIGNGRSIFLDGGTTLMYFAKVVPDDNLSIITTAANIALETIKKPSATVVILGGLLNRNTLAVSGPNTLKSVKEVNIDLAFMGTTGFTLENGFTNANIYECELKKTVIQRAKKVIMLMDTGKMNKNMSFTFATLADIDVLICEKLLPNDYMEQLDKNNVQLI